MIAALASLALAAAPEPSTVTLHGVGNLRIGMSVLQLRRQGAVESFAPDDEVDCGYWTIPQHEGLSFMVSGKRVVRIDVNDSNYRTASGAYVGMGEERVRQIYGSVLTVEPHPYAFPEGHYLVYRARSEPYGLIFETDGERVESYRVGLWDHVQLIEGCS